MYETVMKHVRRKVEGRKGKKREVVSSGGRVEQHTPSHCGVPDISLDFLSVPFSFAILSSSLFIAASLSSPSLDGFACGIANTCRCKHCINIK